MINKIFFSVGLLITVLLSGCATNPSPTTPIASNCVNQIKTLPVDSTLQGQSNKFSGDLYDCQMTNRLKTIGMDAAIGAAVGAGTGALIAKVAGLNAGYGALIGGGVGALAGAGYGKLEADRNDSADEVTIAKDALKVLQKDNENLEAYIIQAGNTIIADDDKFRDIEKKLRKKKISSAEAEQEVEKLNADKRVLQSTLATLKKRKQVAEQSLAKIKNDPGLTAEMTKYQNQINSLETIVAQIPERSIPKKG